jgi:hypothetical protein
MTGLREDLIACLAGIDGFIDLRNLVAHGSFVLDARDPSEKMVTEYSLHSFGKTPLSLASLDRVSSEAMKLSDDFSESASRFEFLLHKEANSWLQPSPPAST